MVCKPQKSGYFYLIRAKKLTFFLKKSFLKGLRVVSDGWVKMFYFYGDLEDINVPYTTKDDVRGLGEPPFKLHNSF